MSKFKIFFIPTDTNSHRPHVFRHKSLFAIAGLIVLSQLAFSFFGLDTSRAGASTTITTTEIISLTNSKRSQLGLNPLQTSTKLTTAAKNKAADMFKQDYWSHTSPQGVTPWYWITQTGYEYLYAGENLAKDFITAQSAVDAWMASSTHKSNIISPYYKDMGIAVVEGKLQGKPTVLVVQIFGQAQPTKIGQSEASIQKPTEGNTVLAPTIIKPADQSYVNSPRPTISGKSPSDSTVTLFDDNSTLGTVTTKDDEESFSFKPINNLVDGKHILTGKTTSTSGTVSNTSKKTTVFIDTVAPKIIPESLKTEGINDALGERFIISVELENQPDTVLLNIDEYSSVLNQNECQINMTRITVVKAREPNVCSTYTADVIPPGSALSQGGRLATILALDKAGNTDSLEFKLPTTTGVLAGFSATSIPLYQHLLQNPPSAFINLLLISILTVLLIIDSFIIYKKGLLRQNSHSSVQAAMLILGMITMLFLQGGSII